MTRAESTNPPLIDAATLQQLRQGPDAPRLLDVRTAAEFETSHIPGAYHVPLDSLKEHRAELRQHLDEQYVLVCRSGARAAQAAKVLAEVGLPNLRVLDGGILAWQTAGGPVTRGRPRWELERQVRLVAGAIVLVSVVGSVLVPGLQWVAAAVGAGLTVAALTNTCLMGALLSKLPYNRGAARCDLPTAIGRLREDPAR
jgi:rhodanese-related sulfurtransferase